MGGKDPAWTNWRACITTLAVAWIINQSQIRAESTGLKVSYAFLKYVKAKTNKFQSKRWIIQDVADEVFRDILLCLKFSNFTPRENLSRHNGLKAAWSGLDLFLCWPVSYFSPLGLPPGSRPHCKRAPSSHNALALVPAPPWAILSSSSFV